MPKYKPVLAHFDSVGYDIQVRLANDKLATFKQALEYAEKYIQVTDFEAFGGSFTGYFKTKYYSDFKEQNVMGLSVDKLLFVKEVDLSPLHRLEDTFKAYRVELKYPEPTAIPQPNIDRKPFERWTTSSEENERLRDGKRLIECIEHIQKHVKVFPFDLQKATSGFLRYNMRTREYEVNI